MKRILAASCMIFFIYVQGCKTEHKVEVDVKPMQITVDVNIRIDKQLEDFFGNIDNAINKTDTAPPAAAPATPATAK